ncbi:unnamed protein product [Arabidopsis lyrata]|uniref:Predicted protein n=1 Tax=Arabidopsis lyrata subsp. lyrata TaxID=81972 RepID=D7MFN7_ARALL|nr:predicted protein [Arabidopsis lyrata subsp. lyrata]CAH8273762.1 unnamed protein product [Arabidopsis lyrata]
MLPASSTAETMLTIDERRETELKICDSDSGFIEGSSKFLLQYKPRKCYLQAHKGDKIKVCYQDEAGDEIKEAEPKVLCKCHSCFTVLSKLKHS